MAQVQVTEITSEQESAATWNCLNCAFFVQMKDQKRTDSKIGNCHVNAPTFQPESTVGRFPIVLSSMWCGQFTERAK